MSNAKIEAFRQSSYFPWVVLILLGIGAFMVNLDTSSVNVALHFIAKDFQTNITIVQWVATAYILAVVSSVAIIGRLGDLFGRSRVYTIGFVFFIIGSFLCAISPSIEWLIVFRVLQALGGACVPANNMAILMRTFPANQRGQALGLLSSMVAIGGLAGPSVGGIFIDLFGWRSIFLVNVPIGIIAAILFYIILPHKKIATERPTFDYFGSFLFIIAAVAGIWGLSSIADLGIGAYPVWISLLMTVVSLIIFYFHERKVSFPVIDFAIFRARTFRLGVLAMMSSQMMLYMVNLLMPFYLAEVLHRSPSIIGITLSPIPIVLVFMAPLSGWLSDRIGYNLPSVTGLIIVSIGMFSVTLLQETSTTFDVVWRLVLIAIGHGLFNSPNNSAMMGSVSRQHLGIAGSMIAVMRKTAQVLGVAVGVLLFDMRRNAVLARWPYPTQEQYIDAFMAGFTFAFLVGTIVTLLAIGAAIVRKSDVEKEQLARRQQENVSQRSQQ